MKISLKRLGVYLSLLTVIFAVIHFDQVRTSTWDYLITNHGNLIEEYEVGSEGEVTGSDSFMMYRLKTKMTPIETLEYIKARNEMKKEWISFWVKIVLSGLFTIVSFIIILSKKSSKGTKKWAFSGRLYITLHRTIFSQ